jgi:hypothetical protein
VTQTRYIKNTLIAAKVEISPGTDALPTGADNAILCSSMSITPLDAQNIPRNLIRKYFGGSEQLVGPASVKVNLKVELAGSGTAGTAPAWGVLLQGCAVAEGVLSTPARVEYTPATDNLKTLTIYYYDDGVLHKLLGVMGDATLSAKVGEIPSLSFDFIGLDGGIAVANDSGTYTAWKKPVAMTKATVVDIALGAAYAAGALTGGTPHSSSGLELKFGNKVDFDALLGEESVDITDRESTGSTELKLTAADEVAMMALVKANTTQGLGLTIGTAAGNKIIVFGPAAQMLAPKKVDRNGRRLNGYDLRFVPVNGNDEWRFVTQ